jgi:hypothetical protein
VVDFWYGCFKPTHDEILKNYSLLGYSSPSEIFPIAISSDVEVANSISNGILDGFMYYSKNEVNDLSHILKTDIKIIV